MAKRRNSPADPSRLGDLFPGDRATIETEWGEVPIRVSWHQGGHTFFRYEAADMPARAPVEFLPASTPIVSLGELMPRPTKTRRKHPDHRDDDDPLLKGVS